MAGLAAFYVIAAIAASESGPEYAVAALVAGTVPATAAVLTYATARRKTKLREDGHLDDLSVEDDSPFPAWASTTRRQWATPRSCTARSRATTCRPATPGAAGSRSRRAPAAARRARRTELHR